MKLIERFLLRQFEETVMTGSSITDAKKKLNIYEMTRQGELSEQCKQTLLDMTERFRIVGHISLSDSVQNAPNKLER